MRRAFRAPPRLLKKAVRAPALAASWLEKVAEEAAALCGEGIEEGWGGCGTRALAVPFSE
jgi:hypothetical protein